MTPRVIAFSRGLRCDVVKPEVFVFDAPMGRISRFADKTEALAEFAASVASKQNPALKDYFQPLFANRK